MDALLHIGGGLMVLLAAAAFALMIWAAQRSH
jgi:hypothetical protein